MWAYTETRENGDYMVPAAQWGQAPPPPGNKVVAQSGQIQKTKNTHTDRGAGLFHEQPEHSHVPLDRGKRKQKCFAL